MRTAWIALALVVLGTTGCLGDTGSVEEVDPSSTDESGEAGANPSAPSQTDQTAENATWTNRTVEGKITGTGAAGITHVNLGPLSENATGSIDVPGNATLLRLAISSEWGVELHLSAPGCEHDRLSNCHREAGGNGEVEHTVSVAEPTPGSWGYELHSPHDLSSQSFTFEIAKRLSSTAASD